MLLCRVNLAVEFIKYQLEAKGRYRIHSPFVYEFVSQVLLTPYESSHQKTLRDFRSSLKNNHEKINFKDFGAGSKRLNETRSVREIYLNSATQGKYGQILYAMTKHYQPQNILEFGTSLGVGTLSMHLGNSNALIDTVEANEEVYSLAKMNLHTFSEHASNIHFHPTTFDQFIVKSLVKTYDMIFIDGHHDGTALLDYLDKLVPFTHNQTLIVLDDIRWSESMYDAWKQCQTRHEFHVTLDLFSFGIVIPRKEQEKQHFVIRY
jgi:predicted O-methyltransferase YrrM